MREMAAQTAALRHLSQQQYREAALADLSIEDAVIEKCCAAEDGAKQISNPNAQWSTDRLILPACLASTPLLRSARESHPTALLREACVLRIEKQACALYQDEL